MLGAVPCFRQTENLVIVFGLGLSAESDAVALSLKPQGFRQPENGCRAMDWGLGQGLPKVVRVCVQPCDECRPGKPFGNIDGNTLCVSRTHNDVFLGSLADV